MSEDEEELDHDPREDEADFRADQKYEERCDRERDKETKRLEERKRLGLKEMPERFYAFKRYEQSGIEYVGKMLYESAADAMNSAKRLDTLGGDFQPAERIEVFELSTLRKPVKAENLLREEN